MEQMFGDILKIGGAGMENKQNRQKTSPRIAPQLVLIGLAIVLLVVILPLVNAEYLPHKQNTDFELLITSNNATACNWTYIQHPDGSKAVYNKLMTKSGQDFNYTISSGNFSQIGISCMGITCFDGSSYESGSICRDVTPTGKAVTDIGQISTGILYFFVILGFGFVFLGFLFLKNKSLWVAYVGLFLMIVVFGFLYYDLHLSNLYATTIAINSGAGTTTTGAFLMIVRFLKLAPYIVAGVIAFSSVALLRASIKTKKSADGWDNDDY